LLTEVVAENVVTDVNWASSGVAGVCRWKAIRAPRQLSRQIVLNATADVGQVERSAGCPELPFPVIPHISIM
jgi:hypothetical protein